MGLGKELTIHVPIHKRNQLHLQSLELWNKHMENLFKNQNYKSQIKLISHSI